MPYRIHVFYYKVTVLLENVDLNDFKIVMATRLISSKFPNAESTEWADQ